MIVSEAEMATMRRRSRQSASGRCAYRYPATREVNLAAGERLDASLPVIQHVVQESMRMKKQAFRELKRCVEAVIQKVDVLSRFLQQQDLPFHIKDFDATPFVVKKEHIDLFLKRRAVVWILAFNVCVYCLAYRLKH
jgi:hypothetical protein